MSDKMVRIKIKPLRGIGGIGGPGTVANIPKKDAKHWVEEGYAEYFKEKPQVVNSSAASKPTASKPSKKGAAAPKE